jgi:hypothetical protein
MRDRGVIFCARRETRAGSLVRETARQRWYQYDETDLPYQMLQTMALMYVTEQLERAGMFLHAVWRSTVEGDRDGTWDLIGASNAHMFRVGKDFAARSMARSLERHG